jgi:3,4-dihydroxy 2-butanone 4-phosphate synthase/GTP cyclohydrolase II
MRLAGLSPAAVICEIMNDDGTMARLPDLVAFADRHGLKIGAIDALIAYRLTHDRVVCPAAQIPAQTFFGQTFDLHVFETTVEPGEHLALVKGDLAAPGPVLVRVHAVDVLADLLGLGHALSAHPAIPAALRAISDAGRGVLVLIRDLRPKSVSDRIAQRDPPGDAKRMLRERRQLEIGVGCQILRQLGVKEMVLLTNSPPHVYTAVEAFGLHIAATKPLE